MPEGILLFRSFRETLLSLGKPNPKRVCFSHDLSFAINWLGDDKMPRAKKDTANAKSAGNKSYKSNVSWINISLTDSDADNITGVSYDADNVASQLVGLCLEGYSIGVKPTADADGWMAYLTGIAADNDAVTVGVAGYSDTPIDAIISLLYKFHDKLDGVLNAPASSVTRKFR